VDQFQQSWYSDVQNPPKGLTYRLFKENLKIISVLWLFRR